MRHRVQALSSLTLLVGLLAAAPPRAQAATCGEARPSLDAITTAEGIVIAPDGTIYFSQPFDGPNPSFLARYRAPYNEAPEIRWLDMGGDALGIMLDPGRNVIYAGSRTAKKLLKITLSDPPVVTPLADAPEGINGVTLADDGSIYYNGQDAGHVYRVTPEGVKTQVTKTPITQPNGLAFGPDGKIYVVSWTTTEVTRLTVADGVETSRELFATLPQVEGDGIAFDAKGRIYVTASSTLYELSPDGKTVTPLGRSAGANIDFGAGPLACSDMYIAGNGQGIRLFRHDTPGLDVPWHKAAPAPPAVSAGPPQIAFPGQYALAPATWRFPVWPAGCSRFPGEEKACLDFVASDYGRLARFAEADAALAAPRPGEKRVVFFGDSITDNWSKAGYGGFFPGKPYVNRGIGGQTTSQMLVRFRADVVALRPRAVVILAGTNDVAGNSGPIRIEDIEANVATMAEIARVHGIRVVLSSILPVADDKKDRSGRPLNWSRTRPLASLRALNEWLADYARKNGHVYLDYFTAFADANGVLKTELNDDGLHPNAAGYAVMAQLAEAAITRALAAPR